MARHRKRGARERIARRTAPGSAPGTLTVDPHAHPTSLRLIAYGPDGFVEEDVARVADLPGRMRGWPVAWIDVVGLGTAEVLLELGELFDLHKLALEDVVNVPQRAKLETYGEGLFFVARMSVPVEGSAAADEQLSLFCGKGWTISFQERPGDCLEGVRERIRRGGINLRNRGSDYLLYALIDAVVDAYFPLLEQMADRLDALEDEVLFRPERESMTRIHRIKRELVHLRARVWPHREAINALIRDDGGRVDETTKVYLRDAYDHAIRVVDLLETQREIASDLMSSYMSSVSNKMNEVMKVLTIIATIFIPLSFLAGIYGMNFDTGSPWNMPELGFRYGYPVLLGLMVGVGGGMLAWFWRKGWFD